MRTIRSSAIRLFGLLTLITLSLAASGAGWAQQRPAAGPTCDMNKASACTDQKVVACQSTYKGNQQAIGKCQMDANMACYQQNNCPTSAR
jgi:hypothetical protein